MTSQIDLVMTLVDVMSPEERGELFRRLAVSLEYPDIVVGKLADAEEIFETSTSAAIPKAVAKSKRKQPLWYHSVVGVNETKKGMDAIEGEWISAMTDVAEGEVALVGSRWPTKKYALVKRHTGCDDTLDDHIIKNGSLIGSEIEKFKEVIESVKKILDV